MAIYKVVKDRILFPLFYLAGTGKYATQADIEAHKADKSSSPLAVDERGNPLVVHEIVRKDSLVYTDGSDFDSLSDADKKKAFYVDDKYSVNRYLEKSAYYVSLRQEPVLEPYTAEGSGDGDGAEASGDDKKPARGARANKNNNDK